MLLQVGIYYPHASFKLHIWETRKFDISFGYFVVNVNMKLDTFAQKSRFKLVNINVEKLYNNIF